MKRPYLGFQTNTAVRNKRQQLEHCVPAIPDWANDKHTVEGTKLLRGIEHFRAEAAKLVPPPTEPDTYVEEVPIVEAEEAAHEADDAT